MHFCQEYNMRETQTERTPIFMVGVAQDTVNPVAEAVAEAPDLYLLPIAIGHPELDRVQVGQRKIRNVIFTSEYLVDHYISFYREGTNFTSTTEGSKAAQLCQRIYTGLPEMDSEEIAVDVTGYGTDEWLGGLAKFLSFHTPVVLAAKETDREALETQVRESGTSIFVVHEVNVEDVLSGIRFLRDRVKAGDIGKVFSPEDLMKTSN